MYVSVMDGKAEESLCEVRLPHSDTSVDDLLLFHLYLSVFSCDLCP